MQAKVKIRKGPFGGPWVYHVWERDFCRDATGDFVVSRYVDGGFASSQQGALADAGIAWKHYIHKADWQETHHSEVEEDAA